MSSLPPTQFTDWTEFGYASFYKRYVAGLRALARARFRCSPEAADALAHEFLAEACLAESGGLLANFRRGARFRSYVARAFDYHCRRRLAPGKELPLPAEALPGPADDDPAWRLVHEEADQLRGRVRAAVETARRALLQGELPEAEREYLQLKWPTDPALGPRSDREIGRRLASSGLLEAPSPAAEVRAASRLGARVGAKLLRCIRAQLEDEYRRVFPQARVPSETQLSLNAIVHVLSFEEQGSDAEGDGAAG
ncbi:MAG: sigma-70 family RNA polymerase sigma factor [Planctomycetes bacterium]|nr:sigma-70 family RNA polymerase sigma factor [Planctomycetota bacterium]